MSKTGGNKDARALTGSLMEIIQEEIWHGRQGPVFIMGDFNVVPNTLETVQDMIERER